MAKHWPWMKMYFLLNTGIFQLAMFTRWYSFADFSVLGPSFFCTLHWPSGGLGYTRHMAQPRYLQNLPNFHPFPPWSLNISKEIVRSFMLKHPLILFPFKLLFSHHRSLNMQQNAWGSWGMVSWSMTIDTYRKKFWVNPKTWGIRSGERAHSNQRFNRPISFETICAWGLNSHYFHIYI